MLACLHGACSVHVVDPGLVSLQVVKLPTHDVCGGENLNCLPRALMGCLGLLLPDLQGDAALVNLRHHAHHKIASEAGLFRHMVQAADQEDGDVYHHLCSSQSTMGFLGMAALALILDRWSHHVAPSAV